MWPFTKRVSSDYCAGCQARMQHLDDLRRLLDLEKGEKESLLRRFIGLNTQREENFTHDAERVGGLSPSLANQRMKAHSSSAEIEAKKSYWLEKMKAGKALDKEIEERLKPKAEENAPTDAAS